jgi:hypothetical protein
MAPSTITIKFEFGAEGVSAPSPLDSAHGHQVAEEGSTQSEAPEPQEKKSRK